MWDRQRPQQERVDEREDRRIGTDAECKRGDDRAREGGPAFERSNAKAQIARDGLEARGPAHLAARLLHLLDAAEFDARAAQRRLVRHALPRVLLSLVLDVGAELRVELLLDGGAREQCA